MSDTTATHATITLSGVWVEYWTDREYDSPSADAEYRTIDAKIKAGLRTRGRGRATTIELTHEELVILEEVAELMVIVADQSEPGPERSRELRAAKAAHIVLLDALGEWNHELAHGEAVPGASATAPAATEDEQPVTVSATGWFEPVTGKLDHDAVRKTFAGFEFPVTSTDHAAKLLIDSGALSTFTVPDAAVHVAASWWAQQRWLADDGWGDRFRAADVLADLALALMYTLLADEATARDRAYGRIAQRRVTDTRKVTELAYEEAYGTYRQACERARICTTLDCRKPSPFAPECAEHCPDAEDSHSHSHAGESLAFLVAHPPTT